MFKKVETKEIKSILERLESELKFGDLTYRKRVEVEVLVYDLKTWLEWKDYREKEHYNEVIQSES